MNGKSPQPVSDADEILRDVLKEHRGDWFVEYHCASRFLPCAILNVTFLKGSTDATFVKKAMEQEMRDWLARYPVPVMVYGIDEREDTIRFPGNDGSHMLTAYVDLASNRIVSRWGLMKDAELPAEQLASAYLGSIYANVPFRLRSKIRADARRARRQLVRGGTVIVFLVVVVPVLIELIALGVTWLGYLFSAISIGAGFYKIAKTFGWLKQSERDKVKAEEELQMRHHHHHCVRNPRAFEKLRAENFAKDAEQRIAKESDELLNAQRDGLAKSNHSRESAFKLT